MSKWWLGEFGTSCCLHRSGVAYLFFKMVYLPPSFNLDTLFFWQHDSSSHTVTKCATAKKEASFLSCLFVLSQDCLQKTLFGCDQVTHKSSFVTLTFLSRFFFRFYGHISRSTQRLLVSPLAFCKAFVDLDDLTLPEDWSGSLEPTGDGKPHGGWKKKIPCW